MFLHSFKYGVFILSSLNKKDSVRIVSGKINDLIRIMDA